MSAFTSGTDWSFDGIPESSEQHEDTTTTVRPSSFVANDDVSAGDAQPTSQPGKSDPEYQEPSQTASDGPAASERHWPTRQCRICLENVVPTVEISPLPIPAALRPSPTITYVSEDGGRLLRPCKCKGTQQYVHEDCLQQWRLADVSQKRNYYECPTCRYRYQLSRLTWASYISGTASQIGLTVVILITTMFFLGFVADPIINLYLDPVYTITTRGGPTGSLIFEDEAAGWAEHFGKGLISLGLMGFAKLLFTISPWQLFRGNFGGGGGRAGGTGRDRINQATWLLILIGVVTFLIAVWKAVRAWSRRTLQAAGERVLDVPGTTDDLDDSDEYKDK